MNTNNFLYISLTILSLIQMASANSQNSNSKPNGDQLEKEKPRKQWLMRYETLDTSDSQTGRKLSVSRSYYFSKARRQLQTVRIQEVKKRNGLVVTYSFFDNKLSKVTLTPPKSECRKCTKVYYFQDQKLQRSNDSIDLQQKENAYVKEAAFLKGKMLDKLEYGYFEWETSQK